MVTYIQILIYYSTFVQTKASQFKSFRDQALHLLQFKINLFLFMFVLFYWSFVCISAYANVYFKTTIIKQNIKKMPFNTTFMGPRSIARVPFDSVMRFRVSLLLHTSCMHLCRKWVASHWVWRHNKPKTKAATIEDITTNRFSEKRRSSFKLWTLTGRK